MAKNQVIDTNPIFQYVHYSNHLNTEHLNTGLFSVQYSNGTT